MENMSYTYPTSDNSNRRTKTSGNGDPEEAGKLLQSELKSKESRWSMTAEIRQGHDPVHES